MSHSATTTTAAAAAITTPAANAVCSLHAKKAVGVEQRPPQSLPPPPLPSPQKEAIGDEDVIGLYENHFSRRDGKEVVLVILATHLTNYIHSPAPHQANKQTKENKPHTQPPLSHCHSFIRTESFPVRTKDGLALPEGRVQCERTSEDSGTIGEREKIKFDGDEAS